MNQSVKIQSVEEVVSTYSNLIGLKVSEAYLKKCIVGHPEYPSLLSVVDTFEALGITYGVQKVSEAEYATIEFPYLAHSTEFGGSMLLVKDSSYLKSQENLFNHWSGVILKAEAGDLSTNAKNVDSLTTERITRFSLTFLAGALLTVAILAITQAASSLLTVCTLLTSITGLIVGYLLVIQTIGIKYEVIENFCNSTSGSGCDKILNSAGATLVGGVKLSDLVASYFTSQFFLLIISLLVPGTPTILSTALTIMAVLALPAVIFSLCYQHFVAKAWCKLCLIVNALLVIQALLLLPDAFSFSANSLFLYFESAGLAAVIFLLIGSIILLIKSKIQEVNELSRAETIANRIKHNPAVFGHLLSLQPAITEYPLKHDMFIGDAQAAVVLTMVSNLYCNPCKEEFAKVSQLVYNHPGRIQVRFVFVPSGPQALYPVPVQYLINFWLNEVQGLPEESEKTNLLIHDWFAFMNYDIFKATHTIDSEANRKQSEELTYAHTMWVKINKTFRTPTLFINGRELPSNYSLDDINLMLPGLSEYFSEATIPTDKHTTSLSTIHSKAPIFSTAVNSFTEN